MRARLFLVSLATVVAGPALRPQEPPREILEVELDEVQLAGLQARGGDIFPLRWRRSPEGDLLVSAPGTELAEWTPFFGERGRRAYGGGSYIEWFFAAWLVGVHGDSDLLGATAAERHLHRAGVDLGAAALLEFAVAEPESEGALRKCRDLDRALAIDLLSRRRVVSAAPALRELAGRDGEDPALRRRAAEAAARLQGEAEASAGEAFPLADVRVPMGTDLVVVARGSRLPPPHELQEAARLGVLDDFYDRMRKGGLSSNAATRSRAQLVAEYCAELPYELVRLYGNHRVSDVAVCVRMVAQGEFALVAHGAGEFDLEALAAGLAGDGVECEVVDAALEPAGWLTDTEVRVSESRVELRRGRTGRPAGDPLGERLELAGLRPADGLALWFPAGSKAVTGLAAAGIFNVHDLLVAIRFRPTVEIRGVLRMRDEDAAHAVVDGIEKFLREVGGSMAHEPGEDPGFYAALQPLFRQFARAKAVVVEDHVIVTIDGRELGMAAVRDLIRLARG